MAKDEGAFVTLIEQNEKILFKVANAYCRPGADREDLTQEIVAQLWRSFARYHDRLKFSTWMYRVALNVAISFYRRETRRAKHMASAGEQRLASIVIQPESVEEDENLHQLHDFISGLDDLNRALMILYLEGKRHDEIAVILGISATNVATKIGRIKERLRADVLAAAKTQER